MSLHFEVVTDNGSRTFIFVRNLQIRGVYRGSIADSKKDFIMDLQPIFFLLSSIFNPLEEKSLVLTGSAKLLRNGRVTERNSLTN